MQQHIESGRPTDIADDECCQYQRNPGVMDPAEIGNHLAGQTAIFRCNAFGAAFGLKRNVLTPVNPVQNAQTNAEKQKEFKKLNDVSAIHASNVLSQYM